MISWAPPRVSGHRARSKPWAGLGVPTTTKKHVKRTDGKWFPYLQSPLMVSWGEDRIENGTRCTQYLFSQLPMYSIVQKSGVLLRGLSNDCQMEKNGCVPHLYTMASLTPSTNTSFTWRTYQAVVGWSLTLCSPTDGTAPIQIPNRSLSKGEGRVSSLIFTYKEILANGYTSELRCCV